MQDVNDTSGIYCIENIVNHKKYIGQAKHLRDRWYKHSYELNHDKHFNDYLQKSWNKYGQENFKFYVLEYCDVELLDEKEMYYIEYFNSINRDFGYNLKSGGQLSGSYYTEEVRNRMSESAKNTYNEDRLRLQKENALKQWADPEIKAKILGENNGMYGRKHSEDSKKKMSENKKGKPSWRRNTTSVFCIELNKEYKDATYAGQELGIRGSNIVRVCRGERKTCGGYHWRFINNEENNIS